MATEERVLCFERKWLDELGVFQGLSLDVEKYLPVLTSSSHLVYLNRNEAEHDKRYKQLIPYVLLICRDKILRYRRGRGGQETRLHGLCSVAGTSRRKTMDFSPKTAAIRKACGAN